MGNEPQKLISAKRTSIELDFQVAEVIDSLLRGNPEVSSCKKLRSSFVNHRNGVERKLDLQCHIVQEPDRYHNVFRKPFVLLLFLLWHIHTVFAYLRLKYLLVRELYHKHFIVDLFSVL